jgi:hypothetical protein
LDDLKNDTGLSRMSRMADEWEELARKPARLLSNREFMNNGTFPAAIEQ